MDKQSALGKKALFMLGMMTLSAKAGKVSNWLEPNCNLYDSQGCCLRCSFRFWMTDDGRCHQVSDQCKTWCDETGQCTSCYLGYSLDNGECCLGGQTTGGSTGNTGGNTGGNPSCPDKKHDSESCSSKHDDGGRGGKGENCNTGGSTGQPDQGNKCPDCGGRPGNPVEEDSCSQKSSNKWTGDWNKDHNWSGNWKEWNKCDEDSSCSQKSVQPQSCSKPQSCSDQPESCSWPSQPQSCSKPSQPESCSTKSNKCSQPQSCSDSKKSCKQQKSSCSGDGPGESKGKGVGKGNKQAGKGVKQGVSNGNGANGAHSGSGITHHGNGHSSLVKGAQLDQGYGANHANSGVSNGDKPNTVNTPGTNTLNDAIKVQNGVGHGHGLAIGKQRQAKLTTGTSGTTGTSTSTSGTIKATQVDPKVKGGSHGVRKGNVGGSSTVGVKAEHSNSGSIVKTIAVGEPNGKSASETINPKAQNDDKAKGRGKKL